MSDKDTQKEPFAFIVCMPFSRCPADQKPVKAICVLCGGVVGINPGNTFGEDVPAVLRPLCGACMVGLADGREDVEDIRYSTHLPDGIKNWIEDLIEQEGVGEFISLIRERLSEFKADNPREKGD